MLGFTPYQYLPLFAKVSIERLDQDSDLRSSDKLNELLDAYAKKYGESCDQQSRDSAHHICSKRFANFRPATRWFALDSSGDMVFVGDFQSFEDADNSLKMEVIWLVDEDVAKKWQKQLTDLNVK